MLVRWPRGTSRADPRRASHPPQSRLSLRVRLRQVRRQAACPAHWHCLLECACDSSPPVRMAPCAASDSRASSSAIAGISRPSLVRSSGFTRRSLSASAFQSRGSRLRPSTPGPAPTSSSSSCLMSGLLGHMLAMTYEDQRAPGCGLQGLHRGELRPERTGRAGVVPDLRLAAGAVRTGVPAPEPEWGDSFRSRSKVVPAPDPGACVPHLDRYGPSRAVKLVGSPGGERTGGLETWPLYEAKFLRGL